MCRALQRYPQSKDPETAVSSHYSPKLSTTICYRLHHPLPSTEACAKPYSSSPSPFPHQSHAQGCAQCRDNLSSTPAATQRAYRHTIEALALAGLAVFAAGLLTLRRYR